ncbi:TIGR04211 family SH3 domain-containing protein [Immundisolibacter sp.]|uniref:TIGR04211 family SH3 domain-containing protein n=1 Tax=Immundisolibacter sp. TaxID=1934948 RepID=UPI002634DF31|nr:TIGR04211 family SH3 domain-containing protein [Immundisolibacter sp.]MDD3652155.1 TIGR04211 family SH3 domain-containing protein [Immundisolibacter sp.]
MTLSRCVSAFALGLVLSGAALAADVQPPAPPPDPAQALRALQREHDALLAQQPALQEQAGQAATLAERNQQLEQQLQTVQAQVDGLREEAQSLRADDRRRWFLTGAAVLAVGIALGLLLPRLGGRRRRGYGGFR